MLVVGIVRCKPTQIALSQSQILYLVLNNDSRMIESIFDDLVASSLLLFSKRYLCQIILTLMRVEGTRIHWSHRRGVAIGCHLVLRRYLSAVLRFVLVRRGHTHHGVIKPPPVVGILAFSPFALEGGLTLTYGCGVIEIPRSPTLLHLWHLG